MTPIKEKTAANPYKPFLVFGYIGIAAFCMASIWYAVDKAMPHGRFVGYAILYTNVHENLSAILIPIAVTVAFFRFLKQLSAQAKAVPQLNILLSVFLMLIPVVVAAVTPHRLYYIPSVLIAFLVIPVVLYSSPIYYPSESSGDAMLLLNKWLQVAAKVFFTVIACILLSTLAYFFFFNLHPITGSLYLLLACIPYLPFALYVQIKSRPKP